MKFIYENIGNKEVVKSAERLFESINSYSDKMLGAILDLLSEDIIKKKEEVN
jgi:hypothetical protein